MIQTHSLVLWKKAETREFYAYTKEAYETMQMLISYGICSPAYQSVWRKKDAKLFDWNYDNFCIAVKKKVNKEGNIIFNNLGYCIGLFSSLNEEKSSGISLSIGNTDTKFVNSLVINFSPSINLYDEKVAILVNDMFRDCIIKFKPFWGCISNKKNMRKYEGYMDDNIPNTVHWINYWSDGIINGIGKDKIQVVLDSCENCSFENGIFKIKPIAMNADNEEDIKLQQMINNKLGLSSL
ncbi:MAG: hypothetical protein WCD89_14040 [Anaerocolumna sp.]